METVYVETTVIGHLCGRIYADSLIAHRQSLTRRWWPKAVSNYRLLISQIVRDECGDGDPAAAAERLEQIQSLAVLPINEAVKDLVHRLVDGRAVPESEPRDAFHIAISAVHGVQYLVTWNFAHIANASTRGRIEALCRSAGLEPPVICTPEELAGENYGIQITNG